MVKEQFGSMDRFYLETGFSKGHLGHILRGVTSPSVGILVRLAGFLEKEVKDFFVFAEESKRHRALELLGKCDEKTLDEVLGILEGKKV